MKLEIGNSIRWISAAGVLTGKISKISLNLNAAGQVVPWIDVTTDRNSVRLCGIDNNLKMLKVSLCQDQSLSTVGA